MKCRNCNGELLFNNGFWECSSCGGKFSNAEYYEDIDVFICYLENDNGGRRTRDSIISQELYNLLIDNKINTFYKRISLDNITGENANIIEEVALKTSKIVLLVGTSKDNFETLWTCYADELSNKQIIPVYQGIEAKEIPNAINGIQALKYDKVGSTLDLINTLNKLLGIKSESSASYKSISAKANKRRMVVFIILTVIVLIGILATVLVLKTDNNDQQEDISIDNESLYKEGVAYMEKDEYATAIEYFSQLNDYNDSKSLLKMCYSKYAGNYYDDVSKVYFQFQFFDEQGEVDVSYIDDDGNKCTIEESISFEKNISEFSFTDTENNQGNGSVELDNEGIILRIENKDKNSDIFVPNIENKFLLSDKIDQAINGGIDESALKDIINKRTTLGEIKRKGYNYTFLNRMDSNGSLMLYKLDNADVKLAVTGYNPDTLYGFESGTIEITDYITPDYDTESDYVILGLEGPATIICPEKIGEQADSYVEENLLYCPNFSMWCPGFTLAFEYSGDYSGAVEDITADTIVSICSIESVGEEAFSDMVDIWGNDDFEDSNSNYSENINEVNPEGGDTGAFSAFMQPMLFDGENVSETYVNNLYFIDDKVYFDGEYYNELTTEQSGEVFKEWTLTPDTKFYVYNTEFESDVEVSREDLVKMCEDLNSGLTVYFDVQDGIVKTMGLTQY